MLTDVMRRPYPIDRVRQTRCRVELAKAGMTITALADALGVRQPYISAIISGRDRSEGAEARIAAFFRMPTEYLFPVRTNAELRQMAAEEELRMLA